MPFAEEGAPELLAEALAAGRLRCTTDPAGLASCALLVLIIGTPVDEHLNPTWTPSRARWSAACPTCATIRCWCCAAPCIQAPRQGADWLRERGKATSVAFCPERVAQGKSLREMAELPQIISAFDERGRRAAEALFRRMTDSLVTMEPMEAEIAKLFTNAWRYIQFATVNQFYMMAESHGLDFERILEGIRWKYPRLAGMPGPGLAAGPCLFKDTMQLAAFSQNQFFLGHAAMLVNEACPRSSSRS